MNAAIVIPIYKESLSIAETLSVANTLKVFNGYPIVMLCPQNLNIGWYDQLAVHGPPFKYSRFNDDFFNDVNGYNRLLLTKQFYQAFAAYTHILICQPDAWVFDNQLKHWMSQPYDYFGAPLILNKTEKGLDFMPFGGNGGFSLRKVQPHLNVLKKYKVMSSPGEVVAYYRKFHQGFQLWLRWPLMLAGFLGYRNNSRHMVRNFGANEDMFWSKRATSIDKQFKPAPVEMEIAFAFEKEPGALFILNQQRLPFGCHAWEKYEPEFWKKFIN